MTHLYFAFGSNLWPPRLEQRVGECLHIGAAWVDGYQMRFQKVGTDGSGKGDLALTNRGADRVHGALYELSPAQKASLHQFEGDQYVPSEITVFADHGPLLAFTYIAVPEATRPGLLPYEWYKAFVVRGASHFDLPSDYQRQLAATPAKTDPNQKRHETNWAIVDLPPRR